MLRRSLQTFLEKIGAREAPPAVLLVFLWSCGTSRGNLRSRYFDEVEFASRTVTLSGVYAGRMSLQVAPLLEARAARQPIIALDAAGLIKTICFDGMSKVTVYRE